MKICTETSATVQIHADSEFNEEKANIQKQDEI